MKRWYRELELVRLGQELERIARLGEFSPWLCGQGAVERLYGAVATVRASGCSLKVVAGNLRLLGFTIAESTLAASLRAIGARATADLDRVFSEIDLRAFRASASVEAPARPVVERPAPSGPSIDPDFDDWFRAALR